MLRTSNKSFAAACLMATLALAPVLATADAEAPISSMHAAAKMPPMFIEDTSPADLARTVETFKTEAKAAGWSLLAEHDMAGILSARGYMLNPVLILEVCSGKYSA